MPSRDRPVLLLDVDGVLVPFGWATHRRPTGTALTVDGREHLVLDTAPEHLRELEERFELHWCTGWRDAANVHLLTALELTEPLVEVAFEADATIDASWKLEGIDATIGAERPLAWVDDAFDTRCEAWARERPGPTHLERTDPAVGLGDAEVRNLLAFADGL